MSTLEGMQLRIKHTTGYHYENGAVASFNEARRIEGDSLRVLGALAEAAASAGKTELARVLAREFFGSEGALIKIDMSEMLEEMKDLGLDNVSLISELTLKARIGLIDLYLSHLFIKENTRRVLLDTDNVILSRIADNMSSLEPFKAAHRQIDLLKVLEEVSQDLRESERLEKRLTEGMLDDPQVDSYIKVDGGGNICIDTDNG